MNSNREADILIVEDRPDSLQPLADMLRQHHYQVRQALSREMALMEIQAMPPDLLLLDVQLLPLDHYQLCQRLKETDETRDIPVIVVSAFETTEDKAKALEMGAADYITKPYQLEEVLVRVNNHIKLARLHKQLKEQNEQLQKYVRLSQAAQLFQAQSPIDSYLLYQALAATQNGIVLSDATQPDFPIIYVNAGFERITGYSFPEVMGKNCRFLQGTDQKQPGLEDVRQALNQGRECRVTLRNYRKDGSLFWNEVSLSPIRDEMGKITYFIAIQTDITERKRSEEERQRYEASLQKMNRELYKVNDALYRLANSDGLTGVANRRCFDEHLEKEFRRMAREKLPLSLILGDIDCFKRYNDNYGHLQGDDCLKTVAQILAQSTHRPDDLVARFGGEEFAILLPNTPAEGAMHVAQAILQQVRQLQIPHEFSSVNAYITLSLGVATLMPTPELSSNGLIQAADRALYQAKEQGRDRVVTYSL